MLSFAASVAASVAASEPAGACVSFVEELPQPASMETLSAPTMARANKLLFFIMIPPRFKDKTFPETFLGTFPAL